jgi:hypothetical protein
MWAIDSCISQAQRSQIEPDTGGGIESFNKFILTIFQPGISDGSGQRKPAEYPINFDALLALS